jgi:hypothetical protein
MEARPHRFVRRRPAETGGIAGALALLVARGAGVDDPNTIVALATVIGFAPAGVTWLVELIRGASPPAEPVGEGG